MLSGLNAGNQAPRDGAASLVHRASMLSGLNAGNQAARASAREIELRGFNAVRLERRKSGTDAWCAVAEEEMLQCCPA